MFQAVILGIGVAADIKAVSSRGDVVNKDTLCRVQ